MQKRYARQEAISGWEQTRLSNRTLVIAGSGPLAYFTGLMATSMGLGRIVLVGSGKTPTIDGRFLPGEEPGQKRVECWARLFARVNPQVKLYPLGVSLNSALLKRLSAVDGLVVADRKLLGAGLNPGVEHVRMALTAGLAGLWGTHIQPDLATRLGQAPKHPLLSQIVAALLVEDMRKYWMPLPGEERPACTDSFVLARPDPGAGSKRVQQGISLVGAGALGTWFALALGLLGQPAHLHIFDPDRVKETNLNRQVLFYDAVGQPKAEVLARRLTGLFPQVRTRAHTLQIRIDTTSRLRGSDVLAACPDNFEARALLNRTAIAQKRILVNGGTAPAGGDAACYVPGQSACLDCTQHIEALARTSTQVVGCTEVHAATVTSNVITGALMAWMLFLALKGRVVGGVMEYNGTLGKKRIGQRPAHPACQCHA